MKNLSLAAGLLVRAATAWADTVNVELAGQIGGPSLALAVSDDLAYVGIGPRLVILDVSDQSDPVFLGQSELLPGGFILGVAVSGDYVYLETYTKGLLILHVTPALSVLYVDDEAPLGGDGASWQTAFKYLQDALHVATAGDEIRVAGGIYTPDQDEAGNVTPGDRQATFQLVGSVGLYGAYAGLADPASPDDRDIVLYATVLSGDLSGDDLPVACAQDSPDCDSYGGVCGEGSCIIKRNKGENSYHVVTGSGANETTVLDAVTVTGGNADGSYPDNNGAAMFNDAGSPTLTNCTFSENSAEWGGGMRSENSSPTLRTCAFSGNSANIGGGMSSLESSPTVSNSTFAGNLAANGSAIGCDSLQQLGPSELQLANCIFWNGGNEIWNNDGSVITIAYSNIQDDDPDDDVVYPGTGNIDDDPLFVDADGPDDIPGMDDDNLRFSGGSPCINTGDPNFIPEPGETDLDGHVRVLCARVDMGAYEFGIGDYDCDRTIDMTDFATWAECMTGPFLGPYLEGCEAFDFDFDADVDLFDFAGFQEAFGDP